MPSSDWDPIARLASAQREKITEYERLLAAANRRANLVSRRSIDALLERHILHSLVLASRSFRDGATVVDWGTGGGLPGIPLAIHFPSVRFELVDSIAKKIDLVSAMAMKLGLDNVVATQCRAEEWTGRCNYAVSRATAPLKTLWAWTAPCLDPLDEAGKNEWPSGLVALKGGDLAAEVDDARLALPDIRIESMPIREMARGEFASKCVVTVRSQDPESGSP